MSLLRIMTSGAMGVVLSVGASAQVDFDRDVRPILSENCFQCHGPDPSSRKAGLRLDFPEFALANRETGAAVVPGKPDESELMRRVTHGDAEKRMPAAASGKKLTMEQIETLRQWIAEGARWPRFWAFEAPVKGPLPDTATSNWVRNPIDAFVLARLELEGLSPAPEADRLTLLRRVKLDLLGLPPTLEEIDRVTADSRDDWYENMVDGLLASPHYGERWARHWMDSAQYADSDGFEKDKPRFVSAWRDWVIDAFNNNKPYDAFVVEQVAGDMLPNATENQRVATGFLRNSMINEEGGIEPEQFRMEALFNRMGIIGEAVLGLTVQCAQCHTHKYDPITHTNYYRMMAFLNSDNEGCITVRSAEEKGQRASILSLIDEVRESIKRSSPDWRERLAAWEATARETVEAAWHPVALTFDDTASGGQKFLPLEDGSYLAAGYAPTRFGPIMAGPLDVSRITAIRLELLTDDNLPRQGPGRSIYGSCALSEFEARIAPSDAPMEKQDGWTKLEFAPAIADINPPIRELGPEYPAGRDDKRVTGPVAMAIDGNRETAWTTDIDPERRNQSRRAIFTLKEAVAVAPGSQIAFTLGQHHGGNNSNDNQTNNLGRFRLSVTMDDALPKRIYSAGVEEALRTSPAARTAAQETLLFDQWRESVAEFHEANQRMAALFTAIPSGQTQLVLTHRDEHRVTHRLDRGDFLSPAEAVEPGVPEFLHPLKTENPVPNRLDFARWLVARESPTTARAFANRVWQKFFGDGIVQTTADLGTQGAPPTHRELLDWLAVEFMDSGWNIKHAQRMILMSATYRQASRVSPTLLEMDPNNRLLSRGSRFRVEGEIVRDIVLAASGLLNPAVGGESVYPPAPEFVFKAPASYGDKNWPTEQGAQKYRRGVYTFRFRSVPYPVLQTFDTPAGDAPCTRRVRSNTPLQALTALNEPIFFECAQALAGEAMAHSRSDRERAAYAFRRCVTREPSAKEVDTLLGFLDEQRERLASGDLDAGKIAGASGDGLAILGKPFTNELAAWTLTARVMLNLDETVVRQ